MTNIISNIFGAIRRRAIRVFKRPQKPNTSDKVVWKTDTPTKPESAITAPAQTTAASVQPVQTAIKTETTPLTTFRPIAEPKASRFSSIPKFHVPGLLRVKRGMAGALLIFNGIMSQFVLGWGRDAQMFALIFLGNVFILADYLWKTRHTDDWTQRHKENT